MNFDAKVETAQAALALCPHEQLKLALIATAEQVVGSFFMTGPMPENITDSDRNALIRHLVSGTIIEAINEAAIEGIRRDAQPAPKV